jgi:sugar (pentulose or hexulose) kinase
MDESGGAALGSALLAAVGAGMAPLREMQAAHARTRASYAPEPSRREAYRDAFSLYLNLYPQLKSLFALSASAAGKLSVRSTDVHVQ